MNKSPGRNTNLCVVMVFLSSFGVGSADMEFALLTQAQGDDGRVGSDVVLTVRVVANGVVCSAIARENCMIEMNWATIVDQLLIELLNQGIQLRNRAQISVSRHAAILSTGVA